MEKIVVSVGCVYHTSANRNDTRNAFLAMANAAFVE
jgi:hypothetical protein